MSAKRLSLGLSLLFVGAFLTFAVFAPRYRRAKVSAFCDSVAALPQHDLADFASRCNRLRLENGSSLAEEAVLTDVDMRARFILCGRSPQLINLSSNSVVLHYFHLKQLCALVAWENRYSDSGDKVWTLRTVFDDTPWRVLYTSPEMGGEH